MPAPEILLFHNIMLPVERPFLNEYLRETYNYTKQNS